MSQPRRTLRALAATAAGALAVAGLATVPATAADTPAAEVQVDDVWKHLEAFQEIADEHGSRAAGTPGYEASAAYVESRLRAAGYRTQRQNFPFLYQELLAESLTEVSPTQRDIDTVIMSYSPNTPEGGTTAELVSPATATGCSTDEWGGVDATGKIALVSRGACTFAAKSLAAAEAGALGAIIHNNGDGTLNGTLGGADDGFVPTTGITLAEGQALKGEMVDGPVVVNLELRQLVEERETFNVLAETRTGRADNVVMLGAHLDSTQEGPGINDNGTGSAAILAAAVRLAQEQTVNNKVRFAWWGAEELGLLGSEHYVYDLVENDPDALAKIATYLNFDMVGSPNYVIGVYDADESTYPAPDGVPIPEGSAETEQVFTDYFESIGQDWVDTEFSGRSDYQPFILNGVPASGLFTGGDGVKTEEEVEMFGGTAGITYDPNYHTAADDIDNVNREALGIMSGAIAHAALTLAQDTSTINDTRPPAAPADAEARKGAYGDKDAA